MKDVENFRSVLLEIYTEGQYLLWTICTATTYFSSRTNGRSVLYFRRRGGESG